MITDLEFVGFYTGIGQEYTSNPLVSTQCPLGIPMDIHQDSMRTAKKTETITKSFRGTQFSVTHVTPKT